jgi:hypothetical protein
MNDEFDDAPLVRAGGEQRTIDDKIARMRTRIKRLAQDDTRAIVIAGILLGILDLLADEL